LSLTDVLILKSAFSGNISMPENGLVQRSNGRMDADVPGRRRSSIARRGEAARSWSKFTDRCVQIEVLRSSIGEEIQLGNAVVSW
jgi:hypothetical protein